MRQTGMRQTGMRRTVAAAIRDGAERLRPTGADNPRLEARLLLAHALGVDQTALIRDLHAVVDTQSYDALLDRRVAHEPLAFLLGHREFWSLDLAVSPVTLIPRGDSETVVAAALDAVAGMDGPPLRVLDLGTGTGCLLLAVLHDRPRAIGIGTDRSAAAAALAAHNARTLGLADRALFVCADWDAPISGGFDLVLSNPPYIPSGDIPDLMPEVARHEPASALDGGADGLDAYRRIVAALPRLLTRCGVAVLELGIGQDAAVAGLATAAGLRAETRPDLAGIARAMVIRRAMP